MMFRTQNVEGVRERERREKGVMFKQSKHLIKWMLNIYIIIYIYMYRIPLLLPREVYTHVHWAFLHKCLNTSQPKQLKYIKNIQDRLVTCLLMLPDKIGN